jgi:IS5 family transposase
MYRKHLQHPEFESFFLPFGGHLDSDNRWVRMAKLIPWTEVEQRYEKLFADSGMGAPAKNVRIALGALIIKERLGLSDEETVEQIRENPYLQYFLGYESFRGEAPFEASMMVHFRKRLGVEDLNWVQERISQRAQKKHDKAKDKDPPQNGGKLIVDATVAPADIKYPTDVNLLNEAREKTEAIIDTLHEPLRGQEVKVRTYRQRARRDYLRFAKKRKHTEREWRQAIGKQLRYVQRNIRHIQHLTNRVKLSRLSRRQLRDLWVVQELVSQQQQMHRERTHAVAGRIVSLSQPHVRPIVRGKLAEPVEFGAKLSVSVVDGYCFLDRLSWDNYNESGDLIAQVERYRDRYGHYPASVHADKVYRSRENLRYCQERGIRLSGPALGRPSKDRARSRFQRRQQRLDERVRVEIEGKFGVGKRKYSLGRVMAKLARTSETAIGIVFLVMGLEKALRILFSRLAIFVFRLFRGSDSIEFEAV